MKCICEAQPALTSTRVNTINNWEFFWQVQKNLHHKSLELPCRALHALHHSLTPIKIRKNKAAVRNLFVHPFCARSLEPSCN